MKTIYRGVESLRLPVGPLLADSMSVQTTAGLEALIRLFTVVARETGQACRVADFLLAWQNSEENGGWDPTDLWNVDDPIADDLLTVLRLLRKQRCYVEDLGFAEEMKAVWQQWRGACL